MTDSTDMDNPAKYKRLTGEIRTWLENGMFQPGEPVPSAPDLAADWGWARQTRARALQTLEAEGLLTRYPGSGYCVTGLLRKPLLQARRAPSPAERHHRVKT